MKIFEFVDVVAQFHQYVIRENTGTPEAFAAKLGISKASLFRLIDALTDYGIHIEYSKIRRTYRYLYPDNVEIVVKIRELENYGNDLIQPFE